MLLARFFVVEVNGTDAQVAEHQCDKIVIATLISTCVGVGVLNLLFSMSGFGLGQVYRLPLCGLHPWLVRGSS